MWFVYPDHKEEVISIETGGKNIRLHTTAKWYKYKTFWTENVPYEVHVE